MKIITTIQEIRDIAVKAKHKGSVGYVPTMGALHEGHGSLIKKAREENDTVIVSVFVNPLQFGPGEDYEAYPRDIEKDGTFCENLGVDYIFHPSSEEMYPKNFGFRVVPPDNMTHILCGITRPIHFTGVATVLAKFFTVIRPTKAYFGQKDVQQVAIVKAMVEDLNLNLDIVPCPIVRENDGLAKSSRNTYLTTDERQAATVLSRALKLALNEAKNGNRDAENIKQKVVDEIQKEPLAKIDYVEILRFSNFERVKTIEKDTFMAMAVYIGNTRLIDNTFFDELNTL
ncbi:pantoate--beta-alanine ligase [Aedoeadaptatus coxii]|uniref:pantoate--beta-alanine ligase n=1 Tax=Aedoeadaptatus coxii TaxID=755172 RepID=UPI00176C3BEA|nr:pantoate--beta-alanine ligase [Peptoniphilus coxii]CAC9936329.1 pantoate--beta-alanine ligase [Peptoniphilus coxii]